MTRFSPAAAVAAWFRPSRLCRATRLARWAALAWLAIAPISGTSAATLDTAFGDNGVQLLAATSDAHVIAHLPKPGGGSTAVAAFQLGGGCPAGLWCLAIMNFRDDGVLYHTGFVPHEAVFTEVTAAAIDSQSRIVVVGTIKVGSGPDHDFRVVRATAYGDLDTSFNGTGIRNVHFDAGGTLLDEAHAVAIDNTDRIVVAGSAEVSADGDLDFAIARLTPSGQLDTSFNPSGARPGQRLIPFNLSTNNPVETATSVAIDSAARIVIGGNVFDNGAFRIRIGLVRLMPNGSYDTTFCPSSCNYNAYPAIHSGRRVIYYGGAGDARDHDVAALAVNARNEIAIVGDKTASNVTDGFVMTFLADGYWKAEKSITGDATNTGHRRTRMGGVLFASPSAPASDVIVTGVGSYLLSGVMGNPTSDFFWFFAQRLTNAVKLAPRSGWGFTGEGNSIVRFYSYPATGDIYGDTPHASAIDAKGRVLMSGATAVNSSGKLYGMAARLTGEVVFRDGFEE